MNSRTESVGPTSWSDDVGREKQVLRQTAPSRRRRDLRLGHVTRYTALSRRRRDLRLGPVTRYTASSRFSTQGRKDARTQRKKALASLRLTFQRHDTRKAFPPSPLPMRERRGAGGEGRPHPYAPATNRAFGCAYTLYASQVGSPTWRAARRAWRTASATASPAKSRS